MSVTVCRSVVRRTVKGNKDTDDRNGNHNDDEGVVELSYERRRVNSLRAWMKLELLENEVRHNRCGEENVKRLEVASFIQLDLPFVMPRSLPVAVSSCGDPSFLC